MTAPAADPLKELRSSAWLVIAMGTISIVAGVLAIAYPELTLLALAIFTGVNLILLSLLSLVDAFGSDVCGSMVSCVAIQPAGNSYCSYNSSTFSGSASTGTA